VYRGNSVAMNTKKLRKAINKLLAYLLDQPGPGPEVDERVVRELTSQLRHNPTDAQSRYQLGLVLFWAEPVKAKALLEHACEAQADNPLYWIALACFHVRQWTKTHQNAEIFAAWTIIQRNQRLLWSVAPPRLLHFFGLIFKYHGDFDRAFKLSHEFVLRHPDKDITKQMAMVGAEVAYAKNNTQAAMHLLESLTQNDAPAAVDGSNFSEDKAALYFLQCRMYDVAASGGRKLVNRGVAFRHKHDDDTLASLYMEAWKRSCDYAHKPATFALSMKTMPATAAASAAISFMKKGSTRSTNVGGKTEQISQRRRGSMAGAKQLTRRVLAWVSQPNTWWQQIQYHYDRNEYFFAECFVQAFLACMLEGEKSKKLTSADLTALQFLLCADIYLAIDNVPVATECAEVANEHSESAHFDPADKLAIQVFLAKVSPKWKKALETAERLTIQLQRFWRARVKRSEFQKVKKQVTKLQAIFRGSAARRKVHMKKRHKAAMHLQRNFRGHQSRRASVEYKKEHKATKLSAWFRGAIVRRQQNQLHNTASRIQAMVRRQHAKGVVREKRLRWQQGAIKLSQCCVNYCHDVRRVAFEVWRMRTPPVVRAVASLMNLPEPMEPSHIKTIQLIQVDETEVDAADPEDASIAGMRDPALSSHGAAHARRLGLRWSVAVAQNRHHWPELVLTSPLTRALQTTCLVFKQAGTVGRAPNAEDKPHKTPQTASSGAFVAHPALTDFQSPDVGGSSKTERRAAGTRFGVECAATEKRGLVARKGRGAVAAAKRLAAAAAVRADDAEPLSTDDLEALKLCGRSVVDLMADRRLSRLAQFKNIDFGLVASGRWWSDTENDGDDSSSKPSHHRTKSSKVDYRTRKRVKGRAQGRGKDHRRNASIAIDPSVDSTTDDADSGAGGGSFFNRSTGLRRVKEFVGWLASRPERTVGVVTDRQVIVSLLRLRQSKHHPQGKGLRHAKLSRMHSGEIAKDTAHDVEVLTDLMAEAYDCCQTYDCYCFDDVLLEKVDVLERMAALQTQWWQKQAWIFTRDHSMSTLLRGRLLETGVAHSRVNPHAVKATSRKRSLKHPELIDVGSSVFAPAAQQSPGQQCLQKSESRLSTIVGMPRPADVRKQLVELFEEIDEVVTKNRAQLQKLRQQGKAQFDALEAAMAAVWCDVSDTDLLGIRSEKYIPDLLRDVFGGVMILFGRTGHHSFATYVTALCPRPLCCAVCRRRCHLLSSDF